MRVLGVTTTTVSARAVAGPGSGKGCVYVLDPNGTDSALQVNGGAFLNAPSCDVFDNSTNPTGALRLNGSGACITANSINVSGNYTGGLCFTPPPSAGSPPVDDPFANLQAPTIPSCTYNTPVSVTGIATLSPGNYCDGIILNSGAVATFSPGLYILRRRTLTKNNYTSFQSSRQ